MKKLLSGVKPTGRPHLGNYFGAIKQFVDLQNDYESYVFIADLHALTTLQDGNILKNNSIDILLDYLAVGLDPEKVVIFKQSDIPEVTELAWIFDCITTVPYLMRAHAYKDAEAKDKEINVGVFNYPILMAADILLNDSDVVPVGKDQKQHIEYTRDIAEKFNRIFGNTFKVPESLILKDVETVLGIDGRKMSKSYNNTIPLFATDEEIEKAVMSIPTDSSGIDEPKDPDQSIIFKLHSLILDENGTTELRNRFTSGGLGYKEAKDNLIKDLVAFIKPMREKRESLKKDKESLLKILEENGNKMRNEITPKMNEIREKIGLKFY